MPTLYGLLPAARVTGRVADREEGREGVSGRGRLEADAKRATVPEPQLESGEGNGFVACTYALNTSGSWKMALA